jgi:hypothetical protein
MSFIIPRPLVHLCLGPLRIREAAQALKKDQTAYDLPVYCPPEVVNCRQKQMNKAANQMIKAGLRIALAVGSFFVLKALGGLTLGSVPNIIGVGILGLLSIPSLFTLGGSLLLGQGILFVISSIATKNLTHLALGFGCLFAGYLSLAGHHVFSLGLIEPGINYLATHFESKVVYIFTK